MILRDLRNCGSKLKRTSECTFLFSNSDSAILILISLRLCALNSALNDVSRLVFFQMHDLDY